MKLKLAIACLVLALSAAGCSYMPWSSKEVIPDPTAELLFKEGTEFFKNKKYVLAIDRFQRVKTDFPFSPLVTDAELRLAETYYKHEQYPEAIAAFKEFQALHPTNENIPFVIYHLGMSHFAQFTTIDRDQKMTDIARGYFEMLVKNHPQSPYVEQANKKLAKCSEYMAEHEFNIAAFYIREKNYPAARDRLEDILRRYPITPTAAKSIYHLGQTYESERNNVRASLAYEALVQHYPESPLAKEAQIQLGKLQKDKEKQDPLAMLLMRDGRRVYAPPPALEQANADGHMTGQKSENMPDLFTKKDIVYEEPGSEKGLVRRVVDTVNPFYSSSDDNEPDRKARNEVESAKAPKEESDGFFGSLWSSLNPFASKDKTETVVQKDPGLINKVDESLKEQGVEARGRSQAPQPPASNFPQITETMQESQPPAANPAEILEKVDSALQKQGTDTASLPAPSSEILPALQASASGAGNQPDAGAKATPTSSSKELMTDIDKTLQRKGFEVPEIRLKEQKAETQGSKPAQSALGRAEKVELDTNVEFKKGPLFLESGDYEVQKKAEETKSPSQAPELPEAVVTGPPKLEKKKPVETKTAEKKPLEEGELEQRSAWDQLKEDLEGVSKALNPFSW